MTTPYNFSVKITDAENASCQRSLIITKQTAGFNFANLVWTLNSNALMTVNASGASFGGTGASSSSSDALGTMVGGCAYGLLTNTNAVLHVHLAMTIDPVYPSHAFCYISRNFDGGVVYLFKGCKSNGICDGVGAGDYDIPFTIPGSTANISFTISLTADHYTTHVASVLASGSFA